MESQSNGKVFNLDNYSVSNVKEDEVNYLRETPSEDIIAKLIDLNAFKHLLQEDRFVGLNQILSKLAGPEVKTSFLVFKNNKYVTIATENVAFFNVKYDSSVITCFDGKEYFVNRSLDQIQDLVSHKKFFRLNRQCLINFNAIREVEHYFARKLLVKSVIPMPDKLLVSKEKVTTFLGWLENR